MKQRTKSFIRMTLRKAIDKIRREPIANSYHSGTPLQHSIIISQPFKPSSTLESKKHNLRQAAARINKLTIKPGEIFSFWHTVGNPNDASRFMAGRSIHGSTVTTDLGGGLCQASGIIHHLSLLAGLQILERHNHSIDLYTDETRFAPIGTDATVFYGYKDLRIFNNTDGCISFLLDIQDDNITATLRSEKEIKQLDLSISTTEKPDGRKHVKITDHKSQVISESNYMPMME